MATLDIVKKFESLLVDADNMLDSYFAEVSPIAIVDTANNAKFSCHMVRRDINGHNRVQAIAKMLSAKVVDYAIPRSKIKEALEHKERNNSTDKLVLLEKEARSLFTDIINAGECGEILLYVFANSFLKLPQVLCKMPLKTSSQMHYHGVDGLHAHYDEKTKVLSLYWGESKIHASVSSAMSSCFESIAKMLIPDDSTGSAKDRDLKLFRDNPNLNDSILEQLVLSYLDPDNANNLLRKDCGICLIGYDEKAYEKTTEDEIKKELEKQIATRKASLKTYIANSKLQCYEMHVFLIPFPSADSFREAFLKEVGGA